MTNRRKPQKYFLILKVCAFIDSQRGSAYSRSSLKSESFLLSVIALFAVVVTVGKNGIVLVVIIAALAAFDMIGGQVNVAAFAQIYPFLAVVV